MGNQAFFNVGEEKISYNWLMKKIIENLQFDEERALYHLCDAEVRNVVFAGPADGESALKEGRDVDCYDCDFQLRYPLWHIHPFSMIRCKMNETCRASLWYAEDGKIVGCFLHGPKAFRECKNIEIVNSDIESDEFGWKCDGLTVACGSLASVYPFLCSKNVKIRNLKMKAKYAFQYVENLEIEKSTLETKDAFWHAKNAVIRDSVIDSEYLGWYSDGLTLIRCKIKGSQPLCYCKNLKLVDCEMEGANLAFEYSEVDADIRGKVDSIKNPKSGFIEVDEVGEIVRTDPVVECTAQIIVR